MPNYRNTQTITIKNQDIDVGSLWTRKGDIMTLVDDDQYVWAYYDSDYFELEKQTK